jgi:hypothetical protein
MTEGQFPKVDGDILYASEVNRAISLQGVAFRNNFYAYSGLPSTHKTKNIFNTFGMPTGGSANAFNITSGADTAFFPSVIMPNPNLISDGSMVLIDDFTSLNTGSWTLTGSPAIVSGKLTIYSGTGVESTFTKNIRAGMLRVNFLQGANPGFGTLQIWFTGAGGSILVSEFPQSEWDSNAVYDILLTPEYALTLASGNPRMGAVGGRGLYRAWNHTLTGSDFKIKFYGNTFEGHYYIDSLYFYNLTSGAGLNGSYLPVTGSMVGSTTNIMPLANVYGENGSFYISTNSGTSWTQTKDLSFASTNGGSFVKFMFCVSGGSTTQFITKNYGAIYNL